MIGQKQMLETVGFEQAVEALTPRQREALATRLNSHAIEHERLLAYVAPKTNQRPSVAELREFLQQQLPDYMVPADFIVLDEWPRTVSGKIDRQALSSPPETPSQSKSAYTPPENELEQLIAGFWREVLYLDQIGRDDNFFDLGGHSLLLMKVNLKLKQQCGKEISLVEMFKYPTISTLAEFLNGQQNGDAPASLQKIQERAANRRETSQQQRARRQKYRSHRGV